MHRCCLRFLSEFPFAGDELVNSDPPYLLGARKSQRRYRYDYAPVDHKRLLRPLAAYPHRWLLDCLRVSGASTNCQRSVSLVRRVTIQREFDSCTT